MGLMHHPRGSDQGDVMRQSEYAERRCRCGTARRIRERRHGPPRHHCTGARHASAWCTSVRSQRCPNRFPGRGGQGSQHKARRTRVGPTLWSSSIVPEYIGLPEEAARCTPRLKRARGLGRLGSQVVREMRRECDRCRRMARSRRCCRHVEGGDGMTWTRRRSPGRTRRSAARRSSRLYTRTAGGDATGARRASRGCGL